MELFYSVKMREKNRIIKIATLKEFWEKHPTAKASLESNIHPVYWNTCRIRQS